jgi:beta-N-acetylhexosaminidase
LSAREAPRAVILGCAGPRLGADERRFFADADPAGFILFQRNCESPQQVRDLVASLRDATGRPEAPILIDQEGGRVARLKPPHWPSYPAPAAIAALGGERAAEAAFLGARLIADDLARLGITIDCLPVLDIPVAGADPVIGDRAYGSAPTEVARLGRRVCEGLLAGGVLPVIKHIPGHGRGMVDSHLSLPVVETPRATLEASDFAPFRALAQMPWAMTAHIVYSAIDAARPATLSPTVVAEIIRGGIGFDGVLVSDDLSMQALGGSFEERARGALLAGCDLVLHCNGKRAEMEGVLAGTAHLTPEAERRLARAEAQRRAAFRAEDRAALEARFAALIAVA